MNGSVVSKPRLPGQQVAVSTASQLELAKLESKLRKKGKLPVSNIVQEPSPKFSFQQTKVEVFYIVDSKESITQCLW